MLLPGTLFASRYEILAQLGQGGMGVVYKARDRELEELVALKVLRAEVAGTPEMEERFRSEIRLARRVSHRNVCRLHDYGSAQGLRYVCMAYVEGIDLKRTLVSRGALAPDRSYDVCSQVADGLQAIHDEGIVHRDLKSANIMIDPRGVARLMDFGIAKSLDTGLAHGVTATGVVVGTPEYMSPEQALGGRVDTRSDLYSLGVVIFEAFTGHVPFRGDTPVATILLHVQEPPPLAGPAAAGLPEAVAALLRRALAKSAAERPAAAREVADALRAAWGDRAAAYAVTPTAPATVTLGTVPGPPTATAAEPRRGARAWLAVPALAAALLIAVIVAMRGRASSPTQALGPGTPVATTAATRGAGDTGDASPAAGRATTPPPARATATAPRQSASPVPATTPAPTPAAPARAPAAALVPAARPVDGQAYLVIVVVPWADVSLDGAPVKTVPLRRLPVSAGEHVVRLAHPDYQPLQRTVTARAGEAVTLTVDLPEEGVRIGK